MKSVKWAVLGLVIICVLVYFMWGRKDNSGELIEAKKIQAKAAASLHNHLAPALAQASGNSFSREPHPPTLLEIALLTRGISPDTTAMLLATYQQARSLLEQDETASLVLASIFINQGKLENYNAISQIWAGRSSYPAAWFALQADFLLAQGKKEEAVAALSAKEFDGPQDLPRAMRLAMLNQTNDFDGSMGILLEAQQKNPGNPFTPILISRLLEKANKITEAAQELSKEKGEGKQAIQQEALADLFSRYGYHPFAFSVWSSMGEKLSSEAAAKALFWKRVIAVGEAGELPGNFQEPYLAYLAALPPGVFWDAKAFEKLSDNQTILHTHQEAYWLRLLDLIDTGREQEALTLIHNSPFKAHSWNPSLENALEIAISRGQSSHKRDSQAFSALDIEYGTAGWQKPEDNPFILALIADAQRNGKLSDAEQALLRSKNAYSAIFMAEGWDKAALQLHRHTEAEDRYPEWYAVDITKALAKEKGKKAALDFALQQTSFPLLTLHIGEIYLADNKPEQGLKVLEQLRTEDNEVGARAAWISAQHYWRKGRMDVARQIILSNPYLADSPTGQEALALISSRQAMQSNQQ